MDTKKYTFELLRVKPLSKSNQTTLKSSGINILKGIKDKLTPTKKKMGGLTGGQKKLDANKDGKISGEDFKMLRGSRKEMRMGGITKAKRLTKKITKRQIPEIKADAARKGGMMKAKPPKAMLGLYAADKAMKQSDTARKRMSMTGLTGMALSKYYGKKYGK